MKVPLAATTVDRLIVLIVELRNKIFLPKFEDILVELYN